LPALCSTLSDLHPILPVVGIIATTAFIAKKCLTKRQLNTYKKDLSTRKQNLTLSIPKGMTVAAVILLALCCFPLAEAAKQTGSSTSTQESCSVPTIRSYGDFTNQVTSEKVKCMVAELPEGKIIYANKLARIVEKAFQSESARTLLGKALADGPLYVIPGDFQTAPQGGSWEVFERTIYLHDSENSNRKLGHFLFETTNALRAHEQLDLIDDTLSGIVSKNSYAKRWERIEYGTTKDFSSTILSCIKKDKWPEETSLDLPQLISNSPNWDRYWKKISKSSHTEQYRQDWVQNLKEIYCKKQPKSIDCI